MKRMVWKNKSNKQLCITIPSGSNIKEGEIVDVSKTAIKKIAYSAIIGDLFHYGHLHLIQFAQSISDYNIVGVLTDKAVERHRSKPIANLKERKAVLSGLNCVDRVMVQPSVDPTENLKKIHEEFPEAEIILVHGSDWKYVYGSEYIKKIGGKVLQHPYYSRLSNFKIINKIIENKDKFKNITDFASLIKGKEKMGAIYEIGNKEIISTKANTLKALKPLLKKSKIEKIFAFTVSDWKNNQQEILDNIKKEFPSDKIAVRSSAVNEDTLDNSMAGCYETILNVNSDNPKEIETAINRVINSYKQKESESSFNQVLIQPQTKEIIMSGVVFTRTLDANSPYYITNYDDSSGETDTVTKGLESKTIKILRFVEMKDVPKNLLKVLIAIKEIESKVFGIGLDIEFSVNKKGEVIIFQVRPLTSTLRYDTNDEEIQNKINRLKNRFKELSKKKLHLAGKRTIFADMSDWNPAEIIGDSPNLLDYSLYDYLITNSAWHEARTSQGYYNTNPAKLVLLFGNKPYIDVRNSFNSFVPNSISQQLREKLVSFCLGKLKKNPELQDKVEFEVVYSCYDLCFEERSRELLTNGFTREEINELKESLLNLTNNLIINSQKSISADLKSVKEMKKDRQRIIEESGSPNISISSLLKNAKFLLDDCRRKGTIQFSRLARLGFIGKIILKSLVNRSIIHINLYDKFMNSINTVAKEISKDFKLMCSNRISKDDFIKKYYHLRPCSYDITSLRYDSNPDLLKTTFIENLEIESCEQFTVDKDVGKKITNSLKKERLKFNVKQLFEFTRNALEAREFSKFEFTKNLSDAIELIVKAGEKMGFTRQELAMLEVDDLFLNLTINRDKLAKIWKEKISLRKKEREINSKLILPPIIFSEKDFDVIQYYVPKPNYITQKKVRAELVKLDKNEVVPEIDGKIVMIENGDPGYDWIFTRNPAGLVTKYGGVASHMSIRCAEFGIPAAIGCGILFDQLSSLDCISLDCGSKKITPINGNLIC